MTLNEWCIFQEGFDEETCKKIINLGGDDFNIAKVRSGSNGELESSDVRVSDIKWLKDSRWMLDLIAPYIEHANIKSEWRFDVRGISQLQLTRYKEGGFYNWHSDGFGDHTAVRQYGDDPNKYVKKLSATVLLNDDYEGGEFQFCSYAKTEHVISTPEFNNIGSVIVFPSFIRHRVTPVTKGIRYSLVGWFVGPPFK